MHPNQSSCSGCYDDVAPRADGGLVLLNHDNSARVSGYGVFTRGDCILGRGSAHKSTTDIIQISGNTCLQLEEYSGTGSCITTPDMCDIEANASLHGGIRRPNSRFYGTEEARWYVKKGCGQESDDTGFQSACMLNFDDRLNGSRCLQQSTLENRINSSS
jgi:hypothetical protein